MIIVLLFVLVARTCAAHTASNVNETDFVYEEPTPLTGLAASETHGSSSSSSSFASSTINNSSSNVANFSDIGDATDSGKIAGIVIGIIGGLALIGALVAFCVYKQYIRRNVKSINFDNPVYRKTTEDQFTIEKNQYPNTRSYTAVSEETLEPLTNPGTNEFV